MALEGSIHFCLIPKYLEYATHPGLLFLTNILGSVLRLRRLLPRRFLHLDLAG